jgi:hypothetical protein
MPAGLDKTTGFSVLITAQISKFGKWNWVHQSLALSPVTMLSLVFACDFLAFPVSELPS